jgi:aldehyde dehydrogenase (NAD+)
MEKPRMLDAPRLPWAKAWLSTQRASLIGAELAPSEPLRVFRSSNPASGESLGRYVAASAVDVDRAVGAARAALEHASWAAMPRRERARRLQSIGELIRRHHAELATLETLENGKLYREAFQDDVPEAADVFDYYAGWIDKLYGETCPVDPGFLNYTVRSPVGVCALIVPWNFPLLLLAWKLAPALAMGNTVVVKPAPNTSATALRLCELIREADLLPVGVLNLTLGGGEVGEILSHHPGIDKLSFTGSTAVGKRVVAGSAASNLKQLSLELGGKSPNIVFADAPDLEYALSRSFEAMFSHKGEKCSEPTRLLVEAPLYERFLASLAAKADAVVCGDPFDPASQQGPQATREQLDKCLAYAALGRHEGARIVAGGFRDEAGSNAAGWFMRPTIVADVAPESRLVREEIFGPVLVVAPFKTEDEAVALANGTDYGLAAGLWTADLARAHRVAAKLEAGQVFVNKYGCYDFASPFGGWKQSGWGHEMARQSLDAYTKLKSIWINVGS